jgi:probable F420-dependent oxidoreductase
MDIGAAIPFSHHTPVAFIAEAARFIEDAGFHSLWVPEHVLFFPEYESSYPYSEDHRIPGEPDGLLDPFTALTFVAAHTRRLRLGTGICLVPQRQPVYTAKMVADVDYLSGGRFEFGVGIGWLREEFENLQMDFAHRAARCAEYIDAMKALWTQAPVVSFRGETVSLDGCYFNPKPVQKPHPPILFGGESRPALARVAAQGDGWYGYNLEPEDAAEHLHRLDEALAAAGRARAEIRCYVGPGRTRRLTPDLVQGYAELGFDQLILPLFATSVDDLKRRAERLLRIAG